MNVVIEVYLTNGNLKLPSSYIVDEMILIYENEIEYIEN